MHQLFLGVTKSTFTDFVYVWLRSNRKFSSYVSQANTKLKAVKSLCLDYCKAETLTGSGGVGRYVSENYLAYARLCKWLHGNTASMPTTDHEYIDPPRDKPISSFSLPEAKGWLKARRVPLPSVATKSILIATISNIIEQSPTREWPPILLEDQLIAPVSLVEDVISSFLAMISRIMVPGIIDMVDATDIDRHIKIFLSKFHEFELHRTRFGANDNRSPPEWLSKYNFITLLNLPSCMLRYGSLRSLFEGDGKGEGALPALKEVIKSFRGNWALNAATRYYEKRSVKEVLTTIVHDLAKASHPPGEMDEQMMNVARTIFTEIPNAVSASTSDGDSAETTIAWNKNRASCYYHIHRGGLDEVSKKMAEGQPLSVLATRNGFFVVIRGKKLVRISHSDKSELTISDASYYCWKISEPVEVLDPPSHEFSDFVTEYGILLPLDTTRRGGHGGTLFYFVSSEWKEMTDAGTITKPLFRSANYD